MGCQWARSYPNHSPKGRSGIAGGIFHSVYKLLPTLAQWSALRYDASGLSDGMAPMSISFTLRLGTSPCKYAGACRPMPCTITITNEHALLLSKGLERDND